MMRSFKEIIRDIILFKCHLLNQPERPSIQAVRKLLKPPIIGIEVGVYRGHNAINILETVKGIKCLFLVDPYYYNFPNEKSNMNNQYPSKYLDEAKKIAYDNLSPYSDLVHLIYAPFNRKLIFPDKIDFIYIDGDHSYQSVLSDIQLSLELVRDGGIIGGHDFGLASVRKAVDEIFPSVHKWRNDWWIQI